MVVGELDDRIGVLAGDVAGAVAALRVDDEDLVGPAVDGDEAALDVSLLVAGDDENREGDRQEPPEAWAAGRAAASCRDCQVAG